MKRAVMSQRLGRGVGLCFLAMLLGAGGLFADQVAFNVTYTDEAGSGFYDAALGQARRDAFDYTCDIWSSYLEASYAGETINISANFTALGGTSTSATLGSGGPNGFTAINFGVGPTNYLWCNAANANHWLEADQDPNAAEIIITFNSDIDNSTVLGTTDFYYGTDGGPGNDVDFISVVLHEIGHGLGFTSLIESSTGAYQTLHTAIPGTPSIYDAYLVEDNGGESTTVLMNMTDADRLAAVTSENVYWEGVNAMTANDDELVKIYAPGTWEAGSSISHEDETLFPTALMSPSYSGVIHTPDDITLGMLSDMGWDITPTPEPATLGLMLAAAAMIIRKRRK